MNYWQSLDNTLMQVNGDSSNTGQPFGIRSKNVLLDGHSQSVEAIILIKNEKIHEIHILSELDQISLQTINSNWRIEDYGELYIFPGIIDTNVHLHAGFSDEWENISSATSLAASAGVTTIVDNPIMTKPFTSGEDYIQILEQKIELLKQKSSTDFAFYGLLEERTIDYIKQILHLGAVGLKCYMLNCFQHDVGFMRPEDLQITLQRLSHNYPNLLLALHPEVATERELYLSSPCRFVDRSKRLDLDYEIKPLDLGGAANKGSFLDEPQEQQAQAGSDREIDADDVDTPSKLEPQVIKQKEKSEITQIAHFELLSYASETKNCNQDSSSDSDLEIIPEAQKRENLEDEIAKSPTRKDSDNSQGKRRMEMLALDEEKIIEVDSEDNPMTPVPNHDFEEKVDSASLKKSIFAQKRWDFEEKPHSREIDTIRKSSKSDDRVSQNPASLRIASKKLFIEDNGSCSISMEGTQDFEGLDSFSLLSTENEVVKSMPQITLSLALDRHRSTLTKLNSHSKFLLEDDEDKEDEINLKKNKAPALTIKNKIRSTSDATATNHTDKLLHNQEITPKTEDSEVPRIRKHLQISTNFDDNSPTAQKTPQCFSSPLRKPSTPNSSLLNRRMSRKVSDNTELSDVSSPTSVLSKISFLDLTKSPTNLKRNESAYNKSYKVFLANRPQNWEENGVSRIISACQQNIPLRILIQNISLASTFLKLRKLKKKNKNPKLTICGETAAAYLLFSEKNVKRGETKYKAAPPLREKENRKLLVENLRLGGVDMVSSYHFYVPSKYKSIEEGNFRRAFNGFNSIGCSLQGLWTILQSYYLRKSEKYNQDPDHQRKINQELFLKIHDTLCLNPAKLLKIDHSKGSIAKGKDADFVIWDPFQTKTTTFSPEHLFNNRKMKGVVHKTILRGHLIFSEDQNSQHFHPMLIKPSF